MSKKTTIQRAPEQLRKLELGQLYNEASNRFENINCLDLQSLYDNKMLRFNNEEVMEYYAFSENTEEDTSQSVLDIGGAVKGGGLTASLSAAYAYYEEKTKATKEQYIMGSIYKVKKVSIELFNFKHESEQLFNCFRESRFKSDYENIKTEQNKNRKKALIQKFKADWGTGLIVKLKLMGGAYSNIEFRSASTNVKSNTIHEAELNFQSKFVSAEGKLMLSQETAGLKLSINQSGSTVLFPDEVESYKKYVDEQIDYLKRRIDNAADQAKAVAPEFKGTGDRKSISAKDLNLKENTDDVEETEKVFKKRMVKELETIAAGIANPNNESILDCIKRIVNLEAESARLKSLTSVFQEFQQSKLAFKDKLTDCYAEFKDKTEELTISEISFLKGLNNLMIKVSTMNYTDDEDQSKELFETSFIHEIKEFIKSNTK
ncbi:MAG: hypothetical protein JNM21_14490 [Taibaiella sp.]|nr:hypothetical protein [Taibaiella sp.]